MESEQGITSEVALKITLITNGFDICFTWTPTETGAKTTLTTNYIKHTVPQVQINNFNGTCLPKICCEYLSYSLTPSEHV